MIFFKKNTRKTADIQKKHGAYSEETFRMIMQSPAESHDTLLDSYLELRKEVKMLSSKVEKLSKTVNLHEDLIRLSEQLEAISSKL